MWKAKPAAATFLNPFKIGAAAFLAFYWYRCGCFLRGKLALAMGQPLFWDPFKIQLAMFLEINISKGAAAFFGSLWDRAGHVFGNYISKRVATFLKLVKGWLLFWDPFEIGAATFFEISISNCVFHIWNLMGLLAQFPYLDFNYIILWPQIETNIKVGFSGGITSCEFN